MHDSRSILPDMALAAAATLAVATVLAAIADPWAGAALLGVLAWFALPGVVLARQLYGRWGTALLGGPAWGYAMSSVALLALWAFGIRQFAWLMTAPAAALLLGLPARALAPGLSAPLLTRRDFAAAMLVILAVPAIVGLPYARVGEMLPEGKAYRAYFTADFVSNMGIVSELSKGDVPPSNPYHADDSLHYYWLMHLLPAAEYRGAIAGASIEQLLLVTALWTGLGFTAFLYFFVRHFVRHPWAAAGACLFVLLCSSFEGFERVWALSQRGGTLDGLRVLNIDAIGNWIYGGMKVDGLHRALLYQPQHQLGYLLGFSALLLLVQARDASRVSLLFLAGAFLGLSLLFSSFAAAMLAAMAAIYQAWRLFSARQWNAFLPCAAAAAVPIALALAASTALDYVDTVRTGNPLVRFGVNRLATRALRWNVLLDFGPVLIVATLGLVAAVWRRAIGSFGPIWIVLGVSGLFYFLVDVPDHDNVYVAWRASHLAFMALAALCGFALQEWWSGGSLARWTVAGVTAGLALAALPTVAIDIYNTQDVSNRAEGPGFRWTVLLSPAELETLAWIKQNTAPHALVQVEPSARRRDTWAYMPAFGERRMAAGLPIGMIPLAKYEQASGKVRQIYASESAQDAYERTMSLCINYLVVGGPERRAYPAFGPLLDRSPHVFRPVFRNDEMAVYAVGGSFSRAECIGRPEGN
jgi:hypothetical protein